MYSAENYNVFSAIFPTRNVVACHAMIGKNNYIKLFVSHGCTDCTHISQLPPARRPVFGIVPWVSRIRVHWRTVTMAKNLKENCETYGRKKVLRKAFLHIPHVQTSTRRATWFLLGNLPATPLHQS